MKTVKIHDRDFFYKYTNYDTAINILSNLEVRWSSPLLFNDPFDTQFEMRYGFNFEELLRSLSKEMGKIVLAEEEPQLAKDNPLSPGIKSLRKIRHKLNPVDLDIQISPKLKETVKGLKRILGDENK